MKHAVCVYGATSRDHVSDNMSSLPPLAGRVRLNAFYGPEFRVLHMWLTEPYLVLQDEMRLRARQPCAADRRISLVRSF